MKRKKENKTEGNKKQKQKQKRKRTPGVKIKEKKRGEAERESNAGGTHFKEDDLPLDHKNNDTGEHPEKVILRRSVSSFISPLLLVAPAVKPPQISPVKPFQDLFERNERGDCVVFSAESAAYENEITSSDVASACSHWSCSRIHAQ